MSRLRRFDHTEVLEPENHGYEAITLGAKQRWTILAKVLYAQSFSTVRTSSVISLLLSKSNDAP